VQQCHFRLVFPPALHLGGKAASIEQAPIPTACRQRVFVNLQLFIIMSIILVILIGFASEKHEYW
jgi:hypothetical protein